MATRSAFRSVDEYLLSQPAEARAVLERVRVAIRKALPKAEEGISYQIPVYKIGGKMVLYFAGFKEHYSVYPANSRLIEAIPEAAAHKVSKGTLRFFYTERVPVGLVTKIAKFRAKETVS